MRITLSDLTVDFDHLDPGRLLDDWRWLIGRSKQPILASAIGDAFLRDEKDGAVYLLDTAAGTCTKVTADETDFRTLLTEPAWVTEHLAARVIADFLTQGLRLAHGQVYSWQRPPVLGGEYEFQNATTSDISVHFSMTGQIHEQVHDLPPGTPVSEISLHEPD